MPATAKPSGSQFDGLLTPRKKLNPVVTETVIHEMPVREETVRRERPTLAKSKDPDFRSTTLYLRKKTYADVDYRLRSSEDGRDVSDLVEELLSKWLAGSNA